MLSVSLAHKEIKETKEVLACIKEAKYYNGNVDFYIKPRGVGMDTDLLDLTSEESKKILKFIERMLKAKLKEQKVESARLNKVRKRYE